jgi:glyoxylase-like metal-dependent hydrolase (beta-lactamase superfamily II)
VHVSPIGAPHLVDPSRLEKSARRLYGDEFDALWGELAPVPAQNIREVGEHLLGLHCFPSPGHASHHVCYVDGDGMLYAGDAAGVRIQPSPFVLPPTPPPELDPAVWESTLDELERRAPQRLALIHFGVADDVVRHLAELRERLRAWTALVEGGASEAEFTEAALSDLGEDAPQYEQAMPLWQSYAGLRRYWEKRREAA